MSEQYQILLKEYDILVELIKHQHNRANDFHKTFLTANTIIISACAIILKGNDPSRTLLLIPLCIIGIVICTIWLLVLERIKIDTELRWYQLRYTERGLSRENGIFNSGRNFFHKQELKSPYDSNDTLKFPDGFRGKIGEFRVVWVGVVLPIIFVLFYLILLFIQYYTS